MMKLGRRLSKLIILQILGASFLGAAFAQGSGPDLTVAPDVLDPILELQRELDERAREEEIERFRTPTLESEAPKLSEPLAIDPATCLDVDSVQIDGVSLFKAGELSSLSQDIIPGCIDQNSIGLLMQRIDKAYADKGHITTRTYIPEQDLAETSTLKLTVLEGFIEEIALTDADGNLIEGGRRRALLGSAYPHQTPALFQLRDLEQAIDQLSRPASAQAQLKLEPGELPGGSRIVIQRRVKDRFRGFAEINNTGAISTGQRQIRLNVAADGLLRASDVWSLTYQGGSNSNALSVSASAPFGYNTFSTFASYSDFFIPLTDFSELFGRTVSYGGSWNRVISRTATVRRQIAVNVQARQGDRFVNGLALDPQDIATIDFRLSNVIDTNAARWSWDFGPVTGLPVFNDAQITDATGPDIPQSDFIALRGGFVRIGKGRDGPIRWTTAFRFQAANRTLFGAEQVALGARSITRGFEQTTFSADNGAYVRIEGEAKLPGLGQSDFGQAYNSYKDKFRLYGFTDLGGGHAFAGDQTEWVGAIGVGTRAQLGRFRFDVSVEKALSDNNDFTPLDGDVLLRASLSAKIF